MPNLQGVRAKRRRTGVRVGQFAKLAGYARATMISIENGQRPASIEGAERIAKTLTDLGVPTSADELLTGSVPDEPPKQPARDPKGPARRQDREDDRKAGKAPKRTRSQAGAA